MTISLARPLPASSIARAIILAAVSMGALVTGSAHAQTPAAEVSEDGESIIVTGRRPIAESEATALKVQRASDSLVSVAASDAIGRLPDQNIAQAASRLPGVAIERDQGQARYISLRGAPNYWTTLSIDGINIVSPEGRDSRYDSIPSAIASQIIVAKAVTPDMTGETIAGNVNIVTRSALDYPGFRLGAKLGGGIAEYNSREQVEASLVLSDRFQTGIGEIGVVISGSYFKRNMITDNFETDWEQVAQDTRPGFAERFWARETENKLYRLTRKNWSLSSRIDWKPDEDNRVSFSSIYSIFTDDEARDNYIFDLDDRQGDLVANTAACPTAIVTRVPTTSYADICNGNTPFQGVVYGIDINQRSTLRAFRQSVFTNTISGDHKFGDGWRLKWAANYTESVDDRSVVGEARWDSPSTRNLRPTVAYDFTDPQRAVLGIYTTVQNSGPTTYQQGQPVTAIDDFTKPLTSLRVFDAVDTTTAYTGKAEIGREFDLFGGDGVIRIGAQYDQRTKEANETEIVLNTQAQFDRVGINTNFRSFSLDGPFRGKIPLSYTFRYFDTDAMRRVSDAARANFGFARINANFYNVREEVLAGYVIANSKFNWGSFIGGIRVERVKNTGRAFITLNNGSVVAPSSSSSETTLVFPSLHLNFNWGDDKKIRIGFTSGAARADYDQLRPNLVINDSDRAISAGNPGVRPEKAYGVDAYLEWYVQPQGYFMLGAFYKRVENVLYNSRSIFGRTDLNVGTLDRNNYNFTQINNGGNGDIYGLEAAAQLQLEPYTEKLGLPDWTGGFGISANATLNRSEFNKFAIATQAARKLPLPGTSDVVYNIGVYYEKYGFSARLNYQLRTDWLDGVADTLVDAGDTYWALDTEMDFSIRYEVKPGFEVYFDATNLLNQPGRRYSDTFRQNGARTIEWERFGRRYAGGVRVTF